MTPRVGGRYRTRAGYLAEILTFVPDPLAVWPWRGTVEIVPGEPQPARWMLFGRGTGDYTDDPIDLMGEIGEERT